MEKEERIKEIMENTRKEKWLPKTLFNNLKGVQELSQTNNHGYSYGEDIQKILIVAVLNALGSISSR